MSAEFYFAQMPFFLVGFVWFALMFFATLFTFLIGNKSGGRAAKTYLNRISIIFLFGIVLDLAYAYFSGQLVLLQETLGIDALLQMLTFGFIWVGIVWLVTSAYANGKLRKENTL